MGRWGHKQECLAAADDVIPHRAAPKIHMEVRVSARRAHQRIQQHLYTVIAQGEI